VQQLGRLLDEASCLGVEKSVCGRRAQWPAGSCETTDVVVGREAICRGGRLVGSGPVDWSSGRHRGRWSIEGIELQANVSRVYMRGSCQ
jgi:hypothetical protein